MRVHCHRNLNRKDWSVSLGGRVIDHVAELILADVVFVVRQTARRRVLARHCREVHAWAIGEIVVSVPPGLTGWEVRYNPYRAASFTTPFNTPVTACDYVHFTRHGVAIGYGEAR
jgi:hypothetical protein